jgi:hypothetical protein
LGTANPLFIALTTCLSKQNPMLEEKEVFDRARLYEGCYQSS